MKLTNCGVVIQTASSTPLQYCIFTITCIAALASPSATSSTSLRFNDHNNNILLRAIAINYKSHSDNYHSHNLHSHKLVTPPQGVSAPPLNIDTEVTIALNTAQHLPLATSSFKAVKTVNGGTSA